MPDLLTTEQTARAAAQGWQLAEVYDPRHKTVTVEILPSWTHKLVQSAPVAQRVVSELARVKNDALAMHAIRCVMVSRQKRSARK